MNIFAHSSCTCLLVYFGHVLKSGVDESKTSGCEQNNRVPSMECMRIFGQASQESNRAALTLLLGGQSSRAISAISSSIYFD